MHNFIQSIFLGVFLLIGIVFFGTGCSKENSTPDANKPLVLVTSADWPPFEFTQQGKVIGMDIDIAQAIADELGVNLVVQDVSFSGIIPSLTNKRADFAMAGLTITPERAQNVEFSDIYFQPSLAILAKLDSNINNLASLAGKRIGVQLGSTMEQFAKEQSAQLPGITLTSLARNPDLVQELKVGRVDAVLLESAQAAAFAQANPNLSFTIIPKAIPGYAIAFPKESPWVEKFNSTIALLKSTGKLQAIQQEWLTTEDSVL